MTLVIVFPAKISIVKVLILFEAAKKGNCTITTNLDNWIALISVGPNNTESGLNKLNAWSAQGTKGYTEFRIRYLNL